MKFRIVNKALVNVKIWHTYVKIQSIFWQDVVSKTVDGVRRPLCWASNDEQKNVSFANVQLSSVQLWQTEHFRTVVISHHYRLSQCWYFACILYWGACLQPIINGFLLHSTTPFAVGSCVSWWSLGNGLKSIATVDKSSSSIKYKFIPKKATRLSFRWSCQIVSQTVGKSVRRWDGESM